uniref:Uncharacterized protein n=1 Tax=Tanacetum cinerariifolium TaxID=118510 RepID=A0A6L2M8X4_TANCI|nr:hypothetical protein [Tanacetum cinerariifolium]
MMSDSDGGDLSDVDDFDDLDMIMQQVQSEQQRKEEAERVRHRKYIYRKRLDAKARLMADYFVRSSKKMKEKTIDATDRITQLLDFIVHHILNYANEYIKEKFYQYVEYTVSRFCEQNISAHTLDICADLMNLGQVEFLDIVSI